MWHTRMPSSRAHHLILTDRLTGQFPPQAYATDESPISPEAEKALLWKQDRRIVPLSAAIYFLCYLDRSNIGNAKILNASTGHDLMSETGMTNYQFTISLMIFLVAYGLFEVPSNGSCLQLASLGA